MRAMKYMEYGACKELGGLLRPAQATQEQGYEAVRLQEALRRLTRA
jgi:hypothetical protein